MNMMVVVQGKFFKLAGIHRAERLSSSVLTSLKTQAKAWRDAAVKPTMPEDAREHQVLAEFAFKERNADKAISEYSAALSVFPTWPERKRCTT
jgi:hypothetical protein